MSGTAMRGGDVDTPEDLRVGGPPAPASELEAAALRGHPRAGWQWFERAYLAAEEVDDVRAMATALLAQSGLRVHRQPTTSGQVMLARLRSLQRRIDPGSSLGLQIGARLAGEDDYQRGEHDAILAALAEATRSGDPAARALALSLAHHCLLGPGGPDRAELRRTLARDLIGESARTARRQDLRMGLLLLTVDLFLDGDRQAGRRLEELCGLLTGHEDLWVANAVAAIEVMLSIRAGRLEEAEQLALACHEQAARMGEPDATAVYLGHICAIRWYQGRIAELQPMLAGLVHSPTLRALDNAPYSALAVSAAAAGDRLTAGATLAALRGRDLSALPRSSTWLAAMHGIAEAAELLDDAETCARVHDLLAPFADLPVMASLAVVCLGSARHTLGVAALGAGRLDEAIAHLAAAVRDNLALGHRPALLTSRVRHAQALTRRGRPADLLLAGDALTTARQEAEALGLPLPTHRDLPAGSDLPGDRPPAITCTRVGQQWLLRHGRRSALVPHSAGMLHLVVLLANPGREVPAIDLAAGLDALRAAEAPARHAPAQPVLDAEAVRGYQTRLEELSAELGRQHGDAEPERAARLTAERDWLLGELAAATGLGGRTRSFSTDHERARLAVSKAIRRAITAIGRLDPGIGSHLQHTVRTGTRCSYRPH